MTQSEKKHVSELVRTTEYLLLENLALKLVLEHREVPGWRKLLDKLLADKEILAGVHLRFKDIYREIDLGENPSSALLAVLELPSRPEVDLLRRAGITEESVRVKL